MVVKEPAQTSPLQGDPATRPIASIKSAPGYRGRHVHERDRISCQWWLNLRRFGHRWKILGRVGLLRRLSFGECAVFHSARGLDSISISLENQADPTTEKVTGLQEDAQGTLVGLE